MEDRGISWHNLSHCVLAIGWGVDEKTGMQYWIIRNSYGDKWGDKGHMKVERGVNAFGIESAATAVYPVLCSEESTDSCIPI